MSPPEKNANDLAVERTDLAIERTVMAAGRTLMGWVRTSLSMISFGFTIYKFLQTSIAGTDLEQLRPHGPRRIGLFLIGLGLLSVVMGSVEYFGTLKRVNRLSPTRFNPLNATTLIALFIALLGFLLFTTILFRSEVF